MTEFAKIASAIKMWGWGRARMILATALLFRHLVTFDQAIILILLNVVLDRHAYGKQPSPRPPNRSSAAMAENRRRPKPLRPIKGRLAVPAGDWLQQPPNVIPAGSGLTARWAREILREKDQAPSDNCICVSEIR
jgi:hypothetical protein